MAESVSVTELCEQLKEDRKYRSTSRVWSLLFAFLFLICSLFLCAFTSFAFRSEFGLTPDLWSAPYWPQVEGRLEEKPKSDIPDDYSFVVDGGKYESDRVWIAGEPDFTPEWRERSIEEIREVTQKRPLMVYYNPENPAACCLVPSPYRELAASTKRLFGIFFVFFGVTLLSLSQLIDRFRSGLVHLGDQSRDLSPSWRRVDIVETADSINKVWGISTRIPLAFMAFGLALTVLALLELQLQLRIPLLLSVLGCLACAFLVPIFWKRLLPTEWSLDKSWLILTISGSKYELKPLTKFVYREKMVETRDGEALACEAIFFDKEVEKCRLPLGFLQQNQALALCKRIAHITALELEEEYE